MFLRMDYQRLTMVLIRLLDMVPAIFCKVRLAIGMAEHEIPLKMACFQILNGCHLWVLWDPGIAVPFHKNPNNASES